MNSVTEEQKINTLVEKARKEPLKGRYYIYEQYKSELKGICTTGNLYETACRMLADALNV